MKKGMYSRLALDGVRKNRRMYFPYLLTCVGIAVVFYIMAYLTRNETVKLALDSDSALSMLGMGKVVIMIFAVIFLFYTHSFLIRRRKREFGLYNILGMTKGNIARVLLWEEVYTLAITLALGLVCGILISKLAELFLVNLTDAQITYSFQIEPKAVLDTAILFVVIFALQYIKTLLQIRRSGAIDLLKSETAGEKPPRVNWALAIPGALLLGAGYYIAVAVADPYSALMQFFVAVLLVIAGTYLTMIAGSVTLCRALQKNRRYYYKTNHFVSVSQMAYRMRRNGAGLATICILSTMVLVTVSSTSSLYFGKEDSLASRYPTQFQVTAQFANGRDLNEENIAPLKAELSSIVSGKMDSALRGLRTARAYGVVEDDHIQLDPDAMARLAVSDALWCFNFVPAADYNAIYGTDYAPAAGEAILCAADRPFSGDALNISGLEPLRIIGEAAQPIQDTESTVGIVPELMVIVDDLDALLKDLVDQRNSFDQPVINFRWICGFDTNLSDEAQIDLNYELIERLEPPVNARLTIASCAVNRRDFFNSFGALFFIGIMLSIVFMFAAVLIIYYKQISEAYEDQARYDIMRRVGMSDREIRKSVNSQLLTVFFLPLFGALCHVAFAFPVVRLLLRVFNLNNAALFAAVTGIAFCAYALVYALVYKITAAKALSIKG